MSEPRATNIVWHEGTVTRADRRRLLAQTGATLWLTGLSGSGKSTVADALERTLIDRGHCAYRLDGDNIRHGLNRNLGFSAEDRSENIRRIGEVARLFTEAAIFTIASFISPYRSDRELVRTMHMDADLPFLEIHVDVPLDVAEQRDPKGLYAKARAGEIKGFTGIDDPYEPPTAPDLHLPTNQLDVAASVGRIVQLLLDRGLLSPPTTSAPAPKA
ncbi:MAG: adenylyl-sulfate kinase [Planctomycetota bacterium]